MKLDLFYLPISMWCDEKATNHLLEQCDVSFIIASELYFKKTLNSVDIMTVDNADIPVKVWKDYDIEELITLATLSTTTKGATGNADKIPVSSSRITETQQRPSNVTAIFLVTGGSSTGLPKAIPYSHRAFLFSLTELSIKHDDQLNPFLAFQEQRESMFMKSSDTWLLASPADRMSTFSEAYNPPWTYMTPNILESIAACLQENASNEEKKVMVNVLRGFKVCMTGGAPVRTSTAKYLKSQGINLRSEYGASEFGSLCTSFQNKSSGDHTFKFSRLSLPYLYFEPFDQDIYHLVIRSNYPGLANNIGNRPNGDFETKDLFTKNHHDEHEQQNEHKSWTLIGRINDTFTM
ncbi:hypothetical protein INT45_010312 [Circinella minor]|uniref:AMP-dependent synthetase/ligase domain-containing protein n=1 Tax=Circinella minor TaxID=1195481 RepID=A0A8H7VLX8_9FUNG|nr:hypothetical protein INT45_010312 [Circinella minor]